MDLYFLRHGDAETGGERPLSAEGREDVKRMAAWLAVRNVRLDALYTSPLLRANQTAQIVGEALGIEPQAAAQLDSGATLASVTDLLSGCKPAAHVMLVGHEPDFSTIIGQLIGGARLEMKKAGLARVTCDTVAPERGVLKWLLTPKLLAGE